MELVVYAGGMAALLVVITGLIFQFYKVYRELTIEPRVDRVAIAIMDRIGKDMRTGQSINLSQSQLGVAVGSLSIQARADDVVLEKYFALQNGRIIYQENDGTVYFLSPADISASKFMVNQINTPISDAIRFEVEFTFKTKNGTKSKSYTGVAILRHSYE